MKVRGMFSLKTKDGSLRAMALCLAVILLFGFFAHLIATDGTATMPGALFEVSATDSADLQAGIDARSARVLSFIEETHSKNFYSAQAAKYSVKYIEQTLGYNRGELGAADAQPLAAEKIVYVWRELFNLGAMLGMVALAAATVAFLVQTRFFRVCVPEGGALAAGPVNKKRYWLFSGVTVLVTFFAMYQTNNLSPPELPSFHALPLFASWWLTVLFLVILAVASLALLAVYALLDKKSRGQTNLPQLHLRVKPGKLLRMLLGSALVLAVAYGSLALLQYLFNEDYRWWMASFGEMRTEYWRWVWRYALLMLPSFLIIGASTNYLVRTDIPQWRDTATTVVVNSMGVWLLCLVNYLSLRASGVMVSSFISSYGFLVIVPITVYITRKLYLLTRTIWFGALVNSFLLSWSLISSCGLHCNFYYGQNWITNFFGR